LKARSGRRKPARDGRKQQSEFCCARLKGVSNLHRRTFGDLGAGKRLRRARGMLGSVHWTSFAERGASGEPRDGFSCPHPSAIGPLRRRGRSDRRDRGKPAGPETRGSQRRRGLKGKPIAVVARVPPAAFARKTKKGTRERRSGMRAVGSSFMSRSRCSGNVEVFDASVADGKDQWLALAALMMTSTASQPSAQRNLSSWRASEKMGGIAAILNALKRSGAMCRARTDDHPVGNPS